MRSPGAHSLSMTSGDRVRYQPLTPVSPLGWPPINLTGDSLWPISAEIAKLSADTASGS